MTKENNLFGLQLQSQLQTILFFIFLFPEKASLLVGFPRGSLR